MVEKEGSTLVTASLLSRVRGEAAANDNWEEVRLKAGRLDGQRFVYFPSDALISVLASPADRTVGVALVGAGGFTSRLFGGSVDFEVTLPGTAWRVPCEAFQGLRKSPAVAEAIEAYDAKLIQQVLETCRAAHRFGVPQRIALWLSQASTISGRGHLPITHQQIARLLAVRRSSVTLALQWLEEHGAIKSGRASVQIRDSSILEALASKGGCRKSTTAATLPALQIPTEERPG